jgi:hypothetical protein
MRALGFVLPLVVLLLALPSPAEAQAPSFLLQWGSVGSGNGQFGYPRGVAIDPSGNVYVADTGNDRIQKFNSSGMYLSQWGTHGVGAGQFILAARQPRGDSMLNWGCHESELPGLVPRIVYYDSTGRELDEAAIFHTSGRVHWTLRDEDRVSPKAIHLWRDGQKAGASGNFARAMELFREAHGIAPLWAQPVYQGAWTALLMGDADLAERLYDWTDRMVPRGYWTAKAAANCLARERLGEFPHGLYLRYVLLEGESILGVRTKELERIVKESPSFAPAWKDLAVLRESAAGRDEAIRRGLEARPDAETRGFLILFRVQWLEAEGQAAAATRLLQETFKSESPTLQVTAMMRLRLRSQ